MTSTPETSGGASTPERYGEDHRMDVVVITGPAGETRQDDVG